MPLDLLNRWSDEGLLLESPAEDKMSWILETGPGTGQRPVFARAKTWLDAMDGVAQDPVRVDQGGMVVFPQVEVGRYRPDFLCVVGAGRVGVRPIGWSRSSFFIEVDGRVGHMETAQQVEDDRQREREIAGLTGMDFLRFSGAEVMYQPREVAQVVGAEVEAFAAIREFGEESLENWANPVLKQVEVLSGHRARRQDYTVRNSRRTGLDPYEAGDPYGELGASKAVRDELEWDPFVKLRLAVAELRYAMATMRSVRAGTQDEDEPAGDLQPVGRIVQAALRNVGLRVLPSS